MHILTSELTDCLYFVHPFNSPCTSCSYPLYKVLLLQMFSSLPMQLPLSEWFFLIGFCLFGCLLVWMFDFFWLFCSVLFFFSLSLFFFICSNAYFTCCRNSWSFFGVRCTVFCTFSYRLSNKKIYFLFIYYNGTKTTKLQTYEAFYWSLALPRLLRRSAIWLFW